MRKILLFLPLFFFNPTIGSTQNNYEIIKIAYEQTPASGSKLKIIQKQLSKEPQKYTKYKKVLQDSKIYFSLYINYKTGEMLYVYDSLNVFPSVSMPGFTNFIYKDKKNIYTVLESFTEYKFYFTAHPYLFKWNLDTQEMKQILGLNVSKATLTNDIDPNSEIWLTTDLYNKEKGITENCGPDYYLGAPGIILSAENIFGKFTATKIEYLQDNKMMDKKIKELLQKQKYKPTHSLKNVFIEKRIFANKYLRLLDNKRE